MHKEIFAFTNDVYNDVDREVEISGEREGVGKGREREREIQWNSVTAPLGECTGGHSAHAN